MLVLVVAASCTSLRALEAAVRALGHEVATCFDATELNLALRRIAPDALLIEADATATRRLLARARAAAEWQIGVLLLLPPSAASLRTFRDTSGATLVGRQGMSGLGLAEALSALERHARGHARPRRGTLRLEVSPGRVTVDGNSVPLTPSETALLDALLLREGSVVGRRRLVEAVWGDRPPQRTPAALRNHVATLRRKLARVAPHARLRNQPGVGYALEAPRGS